MDAEKDHAFTAHIRKLLLRYSLTHLTINYVTYTRTKVSELLSDCLSVVPLDDPTSLVLPVDPFELLYKKLRIEDQKPYDQTWMIADETHQWFQNTLGYRYGREPPTARCWSTDNESTYTIPVRPMTPILTTRAILQTPQIAGGSSSSTLIKSFSRCNSKYLEHVDIKSVADEACEEVVFSARERDQILNVRPGLDQETLEAMASLLARVPNAKLCPKFIYDRVPSMVSNFMYDEAFPPLANAPCPMSPPVFPRQLRVARTPGMRKLSEIHSLGFVSQVKVEGEVEDTSKAHMLLVDGWNVMAPPPTSQDTSDTPSLEGGSQSSRVELDELFALTPPQQPFAQLVTNVKMEEYLVPRTHKPGGSGKKGDGEYKPSLSAFLSPLLHPAPANFKLNTPDNRLHQSPPMSLSIQGQPSSPARSSTTNPSSVHPLIAEQESSLNVGLDALIAQLCVPVDGQSAEDFIMQERIEEKDTLMMDIPKLKEPYLHPNSPSRPMLPASVRCLVSSKKLKLQASTKRDHEPSDFVYLKKVAGVQSLNIELPWRPFNFGTSIPRTEELADVDHHPTLSIQADLNLIDGDDDNKLKKMLASDAPRTDAEECFPAIYDEPAIDRATSEDWSRYDMILTRAERRRVSCYQQEHLYDTVDARARNDTFEASSGSEEVQSPTRSHSKRRKVSTLDFNLIGDSEGQRAIDHIQDVGGVPFSFNTLCSPGRDRQSQPRSQDAPYWNLVGEIPESEISQIDGSNLLDDHSDPIWTTEAAAHSASLVDNHAEHEKGDSVGIFGDNQAGSPPIAQELSSRKISPIQFLDPVLSNRDAHPSSALPVAPKPPPNRLSSFRLSETSAREALANFMKLRGRSFRESLSILSSQPEPEPELSINMMSSPRPVPPELIDANTLSLPHEWTIPTLRHRYIASLDVIQKTILLKHLTSPGCNIELAERDTYATNGVDLIIDLDTAVLLVPLAPLPVSGEALAEKIAKLSWDFARLVVVFEAFSTSLSYRPTRNESGAGLTPYAFSPAIIKAIRKFKRTLAILDGMATGNKRRDTEIRYGYARDVGEAARLVRLVGDMAENASGASAEVDREWLVDEYHEDETDLAQLKGMNVYAAAMILRYIDFNTFIDMEPSSRLEMFSPMVGAQRITMLNEVITNRLTHVAISSSPPLSPAARSTISSLKPAPESFQDTFGYGDGYVEISGEHGASSCHHGGQGVQEDAMEWQTTGLLVIPGKVKQTVSGGPVK